MKRLMMLLIFLVIGAVAGGGYWYWQQSASGAAPEGKAKGKGKGGGGALVVKAARAIVKPMPVLIEAVGTVEPEHSVQVRAQVSGVLQSVLFKEGDTVKAGQLLFQIDARTFKAQYNQSLAAAETRIHHTPGVRRGRDLGQIARGFGAGGPGSG